MATEISTYQCPNCTGPLEFNIETGKLHCKFCRSVFTPEEIDAVGAVKEQKAAAAYEKKNPAEQAAPGDPGDWGMEMREYSCPSCGSVLAADANTAVLCCPYCGNQGVVAGQFSGMRRPDYVIPFKYKKEQAIAALKEHYKGRPFLPKTFKTGSQIEKIQGVYVPFWLLDCSVEANLQFDGRQVRTHGSDKRKMETVKHYDSRRAGTFRFEKVSADASKRMSDSLMDSISPFDTKEMKPFSTAYFPGFLAEKHDVDLDECALRAEMQCTATALDILTKDAEKQGHYVSAWITRRQIQFNRDRVYYGMFPVWLLTTAWGGKKFTFAMNGQTGKLVGDLPVDKGKYWRLLLLIAALLTTVGMAVFMKLTGGPSSAKDFAAGLLACVLLSGFAGFLVCSSISSSHDTVHKKREAGDLLAADGAEITYRYDQYTHTTEERAQ